MSPAEQDRILADLLLKERQLEKESACLSSKARQTEKALSLVLGRLQHNYSVDFQVLREKYESVSDTDIGTLIEETEKNMKELAIVRKEIEAIDGKRP